MCIVPVKTPGQTDRRRLPTAENYRKLAEERHKIAVWNSRGLSFNKYAYLKRQQFDVIALLELHGVPTQWEGSGLIISDPPEANDPASGVAIMLSPRYQRRVLAYGKAGSRIAWVRIKGLFYNYFIVAAYISVPLITVNEKARRLTSGAL